MKPFTNPSRSWPALDTCNDLADPGAYLDGEVGPRRKPVQPATALLQVGWTSTISGQLEPGLTA